MNIFFRELKAYRSSTLIWAASLSVLAILFLAIFSSFTKDVEASQKVLGSLPLAIRNGLGISLKNFFTVYGFFGYLMTYVTLAGAIQAMNLGTGVISKEFSGKTADFLMTKPVSRVSVITEKVLAVVTLLIVTNVIFSAVAAITASTVAPTDFHLTTFVLISATLLLVQLVFVALGILFSIIIPKIKSVISVSLPTVFTFFIIGTLGAILGNDNVRYITPFKFYDTSYVINNGGYETNFLLIEIAFIVLALIASYVMYFKKDVGAAS